MQKFKNNSKSVIVSQVERFFGFSFIGDKDESHHTFR